MGRVGLITLIACVLTLRASLRCLPVAKCNSCGFGPDMMTRKDVAVVCVLVVYVDGLCVDVGDHVQEVCCGKLGGGSSGRARWQPRMRQWKKLSGPMTRLQAGEDGDDPVNVYVHDAADVEVPSASAVVVDVLLHPGAAFHVDVDIDDDADVDVHDANDDVAENTTSFACFQQITPRQQRPET